MTEFAITPSDFVIFKVEAEKWLSFFGLIGWERGYDHVTMDHCKSQVSYNVEGRVASFFLNTQWRTFTQPTPRDISKSAFHEVCELFLGRLIHWSEPRESTGNMIEEASHEIIRVLEHTIFDHFYEGE